MREVRGVAAASAVALGFVLSLGGSAQGGAAAGGGTLAWAKRAGSVDVDVANDLAVASDGSVVVAGQFSGTATFGPGEAAETSLTSDGGYDIFVARHDSTGGALLWAKGAGGADADHADCSMIFSDGSALVTGSFQNAATFGPGEFSETSLTAFGDLDFFLARYNSDGTLAWAKRAGGTGWDAGRGIAVLSDGSAVLTGLFNATATFGSGEASQTSLTSAGDRDIFLARYNSDGTLAWARRAGGAGYESGTAIVALSDDSAIVSGYFQGTATFGPGEASQTVLVSAGDRDVFVARYNSDGTLAWAKRAGGAALDEAYGLASLSDDSAVVSGRFWDAATFGTGEVSETNLTTPGASDSDVFLARYNSDGTLRWAKRAGGTGDDGGGGTAILPNDLLLLTGAFESVATFGPGELGETSLTSAGGYDIFLACHDSDGSLRWVERAGGIGWDEGYGIGVLSDGSALVTGRFNDTATFGPGEPGEVSLVSAGLHDIFVAKYSIAFPPGITVTATDADASEAGPDTGSFTITRTGDTASSLTVNLAVGGPATYGMDYTTSPDTSGGALTFGPGHSSVDVVVTPIADAEYAEGDETVVVTIADGAGYTVGTPGSATVTIADFIPGMPGTFSLTWPTDGAADVGLTPTLTWSSSTNADAYTLDIYVDVSMTTAIHSVIDLKTTGYAVPAAAGLGNSTQYWWKVTALNAITATDATNSGISFHTGAAGSPPGSFSLLSPADLAAVPADQALTFTWEASSNAETYAFTIATDAGFDSPVVEAADLTATSHMVAAGTLAAGSTYYWRVVATNAVDSTDCSVDFTFTASGAEISADPPTVEFHAMAGAVSVVSRQLTVRYDGTSPNVTVSLTTTSDFPERLSVTPTSFQLSTGEERTVTVSLDISDLPRETSSSGRSR